MKIKDEDLIRLHLRARDLSEAALICSRTSPRDATYQDRMVIAEDAVRDLLKLIEAQNG